MSDGATTGSKKPHYTQVLKDDRDEARAMVEQLKAEIDALKANPGAAMVQASTTSTPEPKPLVEVFAEQDAKKPTVDPLAWITDKTPFVAIVSGTTSYTLRPQRKDFTPPIQRVVQQAEGDARVWAANPFDYSHKDRDIENNQKVMKSKFWHHRITKFTATSVWSDDRWPKPETAVIDPAKYHGWDRVTRMAKGDQEPIEEFVALRELTRILLQKAADTFLNWSYHKEQFDPRRPNPYRNKVSDVGGNLRTDAEVLKLQTQGAAWQA